MCVGQWLVVYVYVDEWQALYACMDAWQVVYVSIRIQGVWGVGYVCGHDYSISTMSVVTITTVCVVM